MEAIFFQSPTHGDEGHAPNRNVIPSLFHFFPPILLHSFNFHITTFNSVAYLGYSSYLVDCISIRLTSAPPPFFLFCFFLLSLCLLVQWSKTYFPGYICHIHFPSLPQHKIICQLVESFIQGGSQSYEANMGRAMGGEELLTLIVWVLCSSFSAIWKKNRKLNSWGWKREIKKPYFWIQWTLVISKHSHT